MLGSRTKDEVSAKAVSALKEKGLTPENITKMKISEIDDLISRVTFHSKKAE
jgi:endonuclease-3